MMFFRISSTLVAYAVIFYIWSWSFYFGEPYSKATISTVVFALCFILSISAAIAPKLWMFPLFTAAAFVLLMLLQRSGTLLGLCIVSALCLLLVFINRRYAE